MHGVTRAATPRAAQPPCRQVARSSPPPLRGIAPPPRPLSQPQRGPVVSLPAPTRPPPATAFRFAARVYFCRGKEGRKCDGHLRRPIGEPLARGGGPAAAWRQRRPWGPAAFPHARLPLSSLIRLGSSSYRSPGSPPSRPAAARAGLLSRQSWPASSGAWMKLW